MELPGSECRRNDAGAHVDDRRRVRIVEIEGVTESAVEEGGVRRRKRLRGADRSRRARPAELCRGRARVVGLSERVRGEAAAEGVENVELRGLEDGIGNVGGVDEGDEACEASGCSRHGPRSATAP